MSKRKVISAYYKTQVNKRSPYVQEMKQAVKLYEETKIERETSISQIFTLLKSKGAKANEKGLKLLNKFQESEPAKGKIGRAEQDKRDNMIHYDANVRLTAMGGKVKKVDLKPRLIGSKASSNIKRVVVEAFNQALKAVGEDKVYKFSSGCTLKGGRIEEVHVHSTTCSNNTDTHAFNNWVELYVDRIETVIQSIDPNNHPYCIFSCSFV